MSIIVTDRKWIPDFLEGPTSSRRSPSESCSLLPPWALPDANQHSRNGKGGGKPQHSEGLRRGKPTFSCSSV